MDVSSSNLADMLMAASSSSSSSATLTPSVRWRRGCDAVGLTKSVSLPHHHHHHRRWKFASPVPAAAAAAAATVGFAPSSCFSILVSPRNPLSQSDSFSFSCGEKKRKPSKRRRRVFVVVSAVFERFTERAIKAVVFSQREAKALGRDMVFTQHLLLGLIAEEEEFRRSSPGGFLGSGITIDEARRAVRNIWHDQIATNNAAADSESPHLLSAADVSFSISTKRVLEAALEYSRTRGYNFIAPEHIAIGLFTADDGSAARVLARCV